MKVLPTFDASKVRVSGDGIQPSGVKASIPVSFLIDTREAGYADLDVGIVVSKLYLGLMLYLLLTSDIKILCPCIILS